MNRTFVSFLTVFALLTVLFAGTFTVSAVSTNNLKVEKAQQALREKGYYNGQITGKLDAATKEAVRAFQSHEGLNPTGFLNKDTCQRLGIGSPSHRRHSPFRHRRYRW